VDTEVKIQAGLASVLKDCICFIVAQRISTVLNADQIIVLDRGRIAARGTHRELLQTSPIYQEIYESQLGDGNQFLNDSLEEN
jgi:ATP-binding cassette subfamily B protein